jgi:hypothetical protein
MLLWCIKQHPCQKGKHGSQNENQISATIVFSLFPDRESIWGNEETKYTYWYEERKYNKKRVKKDYLLHKD